MSQTSSAASTPERQVAPALVHALLRYVRRVAGADSLAATIACSAVDAADLFSQSRWFSSDEAIALAEAAGRICHDENIGVRAGIELWWMLSEHDGYLDLVRSAGDVSAAITSAAARGSKMSTGRRNEVVEGDDKHVLLLGHYADVTTAHRFYCGLSTGFYAQVPRAFGMVGDAVEVGCQLDGAECCTYRITWQRDINANSPDVTGVSDSADRVQGRIAHLEEMHQLASQLLSAGKVDEVLARITREAARAVQAPRYLLAVRIQDCDELRVHHRGFRDGTATAFADRLLAGSIGEQDGVLCADVVHEGRNYGRFAACYPRGSHFADGDRRLLRAYARHAAALLAHVAALEQAADDRDTAHALLDLARELAGASTVAEVGRRLAESVPRVVGADAASLWLWDDDSNELVLSHWADPSGEEFTGPHRLPATEFADVRGFIDHMGPYVVDFDTADAATRSLLAPGGLRHGVAVPIQLHGAFAGIVAAGFRRGLPDQQVMFARLGGLADHAAVALQSVQLLERISHQAMHDNLTGLANRQKLEEYGKHALAHARQDGTRVALLFIDLDHFKHVNDSLGHAAGDELIKAVADRIASATRPTDVLARLGGDEFLLMLPNVGDSNAAVAAANRVVQSLNEPFVLACGEQFEISCSIGVACYPDHGVDYSSLVKVADVAMYVAKAKGRNGVELYDGCPTAWAMDMPAQRSYAALSLSGPQRDY